ncbi:piggyBac transposable element-derived protein 4-like [Astyanax mexicanus]|uniref:piggyBac transposable element-derived protein 4-like n=1 Tax=Astyanax mexicanus TaxID=7994 RepID=UPI0020CAB4C4|nr:piggyBac transposable element-derived protein 4-like [Astyanax mexicanus]
MATARKNFNLSEVLEELFRSDSGEEFENNSSEVDSFDSAEEHAFQQGLDPVLDLEDHAPSSDSPAPPTTTPTAPTTTPTTPTTTPTAPTTTPTAPTTTPTTPTTTLLSSSGSRPAKRQRRICSEQVTRWNSKDEADVTPVLHPFTPVRNPGVQLDSHQEYTPLQLFQLFMGGSTVITLCQNTNKYAANRQEKGMKTPWYPVTDLEMYQFLSLIIYCGLIKPSTARDLWRKDRLHTFPFPASVMAGCRFEAIFWNLHMSDIEEDLKNDGLRGTSRYDRLARLRPLMDEIKIACKAFYQPDQNLAIDERMVATKSRIGIKQYMKDKPTKWGFKLFVLANSKNGYTCGFNVYQGKCQSPSGKGLSYDSVMDLLSAASLGTGYHIYVDNFYTSTTLFRDLHSRRLEACGTIRENRIGFPKTKENALPKKASRGDIRWIREGPLLYVKWMDTREVTVCSTNHQAYCGATVQRRVKSRDGTWSLQSIPVPEPVRAYNKYMGGVDLSDALIKYFSVSQKTMKWYKKLFLHFVDIAVVNSYIIHRELSLAKEEKPLTQKGFREALCLQLADLGSESRRASGAAELEQEEGVLQPPGDAGERGCYPVPIVDPSFAAKRDKASAGRRNCVLCLQKKKYTKTIYKCRSCDVPLCIIVDRLCFTEWHDRKGSKA